MCVVARRSFPKRAKTHYFQTKNLENADNMPERLVQRRAAFELQCFRNCNAFAIASFLVSFFLL